MQGVVSKAFASSGSAAPVGTRLRAVFVASLALFWIAALGCSSGSGEGGDGGGNNVQPLTRMEQTVRFLDQATLGASYEEVQRAEALGFEAWIDQQLAMPSGSHLAAMRRLQAAYADPADRDAFFSPRFRQFAWWDRVMAGDDVLRQRVAMALSEIFVVSDRGDDLYNYPAAIASYYDLLLDHAFGTYEDLLLAIALHPAMGTYLSHLNNDRSDPARGRFPDENFAREVMQLFSIGLFELAEDGTLLEGPSGQPIPTYGNAEITEFAKVFTGLHLQGPGATFGSPFLGGAGDRTLPMVMDEDHHELGPKTLLGGYPIPAGQSGMKDIEEAVAHLADHPNVGPFLALRLIQRLVKSNPSPAYIERVARVFGDDGTGTRGNLGAVIRAILLDTEARRDPDAESDGRLREPFLRWVAFLRTFDAASPSGEFLVDGNTLAFLLGQHPMSSPSVFNFFQPDFSPAGPLREASLEAPEFQITTDASVVWIANFALLFSIESPAVPPPIEAFRPGSIAEADLPLALDLSDELALAGDVDALLDRFDLLLTYGTLSDSSRTLIRDAVLASGTDPGVRTLMALHLILTSPDYAVAN